MKYHMRKSTREIKETSAIEDILARGKFATLALCRKDEPYVVTMNYGYDRGGRALYFHCAKEGLKTDFVRENPNVCATVVEDLGYQHGTCEHHFRSAVVRGRIVIADEAEKRKALDCMIRHLEEQPEIMLAKIALPERQVRIEKVMDIWRLDIEEMSGKAGS